MISTIISAMRCTGVGRPEDDVEEEGGQHDLGDQGGDEAVATG